MIAKAPDVETDILSRVIAPDEAMLSLDGARAFLAMKFSDEDSRRMSELAEKARHGELTADEEAMSRAYERVGSLLGLLQSKARLTMKRHVGAAK
jgi:hypothetical protein